MSLTDAATAVRNKAEQAALSNGVGVSQAQRAEVVRVIALRGDTPEFASMLRRHGLSALNARAAATKGRSRTTEGVSVLHLVVLRGCIARLVREAAIVNWLARDAPEHLRAFQHALEIGTLP
jgi:hypothetical protein